MKAYELKSILEGVDDNAEIMIVEQPRYPMVYSVLRQSYYNESENKFYFAEGSQLEYAGRELKDELGW